ncbi:MAG: hypothetical protein KF757_00755 [Phycisphaeraceae bacterium]|nr:hypothetical protein [Phycisphaeraceae bacterium]MCW5761737.1 hypothetical protein [Phycisphaeraceae bacterium]
MPQYEYRCPANQRLVEVEHSMSDEIRTWGELCTLASIDPGPTPASEPVEKVISLSFVSSGRARPSAPNSGHCCRPGNGCCH